MGDSTSKLQALEARVAALEANLARISLAVASTSTSTQLPEPIATALAREGTAQNQHEKFFSLLDAGEACIKYTAAILIALSKANGYNFDIQQEFRQPPTLGRQAEIIRQLLIRPGFPDDAISQSIQSSLLRTNGKFTPPARYLFNDFIALRNDHRGHGASLPADAYRRLHLQNNTLVHDALKSFEYLSYSLVRIESVDVATDPFTFDVRIIIGPSIYNPSERIQSMSRVGLDRTCLWDQEESLVDLNDLIVYRTCDTCSIEHTFFLDRWTPNYKEYHAYMGNHRIKEPIGRTP